jgi:hypothetical protein
VKFANLIRIVVALATLALGMGAYAIIVALQVAG